MVLRGEAAGFSTPFDAPLYGANRGRTSPANDGYEFEFRNCDGLLSYFSVSNDDVTDILPAGIEPYSATPKGIVWLVRYPFSTVGAHNECLSLIQVEAPDGGMAYYCPYVYVTDDAALVGGRELLGVPGKRAAIDLDTSGSTMQGTLERPAGTRLLTLTLQAEEQVLSNPVLDAAMPDPVPLLSFRHLPPIDGDDGITQLVKWHADVHFHEDTRDNQLVWMGPDLLTYDSHSNVDPVATLAVEDTMLTMYFEFDMEAGATEVVDEWRV